MGLASFPRGVAQLLVAATVLIWLLAKVVFDFEIEHWPSWVRIGAFVGVVGLLTFVALRFTRKHLAESSGVFRVPEGQEDSGSGKH